MKVSECLWEHCRDELHDAAIAKSESFKSKMKIAATVPAGNTKDVEIAVQLKCLSSFWRTLKIK